MLTVKRSLIADLYWSQQACVNIDGTFSELERGLRQGKERIQATNGLIHNDVKRQ